MLTRHLNRSYQNILTDLYNFKKFILSIDSTNALYWRTNYGTLWKAIFKRNAGLEALLLGDDVVVIDQKKKATVTNCNNHGYLKTRCSLIFLWKLEERS
ncbi:unnamed protein product [Rhizophagus irregularis]|nr:unnamed protein product [Rhizophagus irregularis]CAB5296671.1 unnamed protein product [Rhizophagus irregularis]